MAEHRAYLATAGLMTLLASAVARVLAARPRARRPGLLYAAVLGSVLAACAWLTMGRARVWRDPVALWREAVVEAAGMWEPHYALADALRERGDCAGAVPEYETVVRMRPAHRDAQTNLGICLAQTGRLDEAEAAFRRVIALDPASPRGYTNLGALALVAGDAVRARDAYLDAIERDPRNVLARMQLASLYEGTFHDYHAAARMCGEARAIAPFTPGVADCVERNRALAARKDSGR
jgi:tetratricopeptide (TPR) repeat protein